jgi:caffeoyl-CoA O-methyltransferase
MEIEQYIEEHASVGTESDARLLAELDRATNLRVIQPKMVSGRTQGAFLTLITKMLQPKLVLEIGTFTGYSALSIAAGLGDGAVLHTVEVDDELEDFSRSFFDRSVHGAKISLHIGSALDVVPRLFRQLGRPFDMVFVDGDKRQYPDYFRMLMGDNERGGEGAGGAGPMVASGSVVVTDNVLWYGKVAEPEAIKSSDLMSLGIVEFNRMVASDPRVESVILPLRDGLSLFRVR